MNSPDAVKAALGAREYLAAAFEPSDRLAILVRSSVRSETLQRITTAERIAAPSFQHWLHFKNDREDADVYVGMNPLKPDARTRTKEDILSIRHLYLDLDHDGAASLAVIEQSPLVPPPNFVLATSPDKFQVIWRVDGLTQDPAETLLRAMAREFGGDPAATDSTRVLRLPGFGNRKYPETFIVRAQQFTNRVHTPLDFKLPIHQPDSPYPPIGRSPTRTTSSEPRQMSQSEYDWAFAKRALASGADPEQVVRRIAEFREGDKYDVHDYARRTVRKAQAELRQSSSQGDSEIRTLERR
ncbi:MAG: DNA-primase RepB domain-containing protein [Candidatus Acidiferrales bacterium]